MPFKPDTMDYNARHGLRGSLLISLAAGGSTPGAFQSGP